MTRLVSGIGIGKWNHALLMMSLRCMTIHMIYSNDLPWGRGELDSQDQVKQMLHVRQMLHVCQVLQGCQLYVHQLLHVCQSTVR